MANALYKLAKEQFIGGDLDIDTATIKLVLVDATYAFSNGHTSLAAITAGKRVATSGAFASKTKVDGVFDAADVTVSSVSGAVIAGLAIYKDTGVEATSTLIAWFDTDASSNPISITPNGSDVQVTWNASGIFAF